MIQAMGVQCALLVRVPTSVPMQTTHDLQAKLTKEVNPPECRLMLRVIDAR